MQHLNISELTRFYVESTFIDSMKLLIYTAFELFERMGVKFYEDDLLDILTQEESLASEDKQELFIRLIMLHLEDILNAHDITLNESSEVNLEELIEMVSFIYLFQNLEDYELSLYILYSEKRSKEKLIELMNFYSIKLKEYRLMEIIESVSDNLIEAMIAMIEDKYYSNEVQPINHHYHKTLEHFFGFIEYHDCLGYELYQKGYVNMTLEDLKNLVPFDLSEYLNNVYKKDKAKTALDVLSLLMLARDSYETPLLKFKQHAYEFFDYLDSITILHDIIAKILDDFYIYLEVKQQEEKINAN